MLNILKYEPLWRGRLYREKHSLDHLSVHSTLQFRITCSTNGTNARLAVLVVPAIDSGRKRQFEDVQDCSNHQPSKRRPYQQEGPIQNRVSGSTGYVHMANPHTGVSEPIVPTSTSRRQNESQVESAGQEATYVESEWVKVPV